MASMSVGRDHSVTTKSTVSGAVRAIAFLDLAGVYWQLAQREMWRGHSFDGSAGPSLSESLAWSGEWCMELRICGS